MIFPIALVALSFIGSGMTQERMISTTLVDPLSIKPCLTKPTPTHPFTDWDGTYIGGEWWKYITVAQNFPKKLRKFTSRKLTCQRPKYTTANTKRRFYWHISCEYNVYWLSKFTWPIKGTRYSETCYILFPCRDRVRIVNCTSEFCNTRCQTQHQQIRNSVCLENNYREYKNVWVFCTSTYRKESNRIWRPVDCRRFPHFCLKRVRLSVPQCCECWSCWDMFVTMPKLRFEANPSFDMDG